jgi:hypothetical protein
LRIFRKGSTACDLSNPKEIIIKAKVIVFDFCNSLNYFVDFL